MWSILRKVHHIKLSPVMRHKKNRRRRTDADSSIAERKAFRLRIPEDDKHSLLDDSRWPAYVTVSSWMTVDGQPTSQCPNGALSHVDNRPLWSKQTVEQTMRHDVNKKQARWSNSLSSSRDGSEGHELLDANDDAVIMPVDEITFAPGQPNIT
jgi:hypothetical protein